MATLSERDHAELREFLQEVVGTAVAEAFRRHPCRFKDEEAPVLHEAARRLTADDVITVAWLAHRLQGIGESTGKIVSRVVLWGLLGLLAAGAAVLTWGIKRGWISAISP